MRHARETARESHEYRHGYKLMAKRQGGVEVVQEQAPSTIEGFFGMSENDLKLIVGKLMNAAESFKDTHEKHEKSIDDIREQITEGFKSQNTRISSLEDTVKIGKALALVGKAIGYPALFWIAAHLDGIYNFLKKIV